MGKYAKKKSVAKKKEDKASGKINSASKSDSRKPVIITCCIALVAVIVAICAGCVYLESASLNGIILDNVYVAGVDVGGMTQAEAIEAVNAVADSYTATPMLVKVLEAQTQLPAQWCGSLNVRKAVRAAYQYGHTGSSSRRAQEQQTAMASGYIVPLERYLDINEEAIRSELAELGANYSSTLSQSTFEVTGEGSKQVLEIHLGVPEYGLDLNKLYDQVLDAYNRNQFVVEGTCEIIEPKNIDLEEIYNAHSSEPVNAEFDKETFEPIAGKDGYDFDLDIAKQKLADAKYGTTVTIPFRAVPPEITAESLKALLYRDELSFYTASSSSQRGRDTNLRLACEAINGTILNPGDVFSYNEALGERTTEKGYQTGASYIGGKTVLTVGGGICQVSSSLYYCVMLADLEVLTRENHGYAVSYMPLGMDATVSWGQVDFRFRNNSDYPIRIEAIASGGDTTIRLIGTDTKSYRVKMEYERLATYGYETEYKEMQSNNPDGYKDGDYITTPYTGYLVQSYRCKYDKATDKLISRDAEAKSKYSKRDAVICKIVDPVETVPPTESVVPEETEPLPGIGNGGVTDSGELPPA